MIYLAPEQVSLVTRAPAATVAANWPLVCSALEELGINHPLVQVGMAATIAAETGDFTPKREVLSKDTTSVTFAAQSRYWPSGYYGRGYIQLTWRDNYKAYGSLLGIDLVGDPDLALTPDTAARIAALFFKASTVGGGDKRQLHQACRDRDWQAVRRGVNGPGYMRDRKAWDRFRNNCNTMADMVGGFNG